MMAQIRAMNTEECDEFLDQLMMTEEATFFLPYHHHWAQGYGNSSPCSHCFPC